MRPFLIAITILTMLAQPVWATSVEQLIPLCTKWKESGFSQHISMNKDGMRASLCSAYFYALSDVGSEMCALSDNNYDLFSWDASSNQLAQSFLNKAEERPADWDTSGFAFLVINLASIEFPCKE